jgi:enoyl-CoA hydratase
VAGADIGALKGRTMVGVLGGVAQGVLRKLAACEKPVIAAVNGLALGGGCELAMACDIRIASENAKFGLPELGLGIIPGAGGTQRLAKLVGLGRAKEMVLTGRAIGAQEALQYGLVTQVVTMSELKQAVMDTAMAIMSKGPLAVRLAKKAVAASLSTDEESGMLLELLSYAVAIASEDRVEGMTAFLEKRAPDFKGQ